MNRQKPSFAGAQPPSEQNLSAQAKALNYILFDGYQSLSVQNLNLTATVNTNPDLPQGTVAQVVGTISYKGGFTGQFNAVLEKVDGIWRIHAISVTVPPDKFQP